VVVEILVLEVVSEEFVLAGLDVLSELLEAPAVLVGVVSVELRGVVDDHFEHVLDVFEAIVGVGAAHAPEVVELAFLGVADHDLALLVHQHLALDGGLAQLGADLGVVEDVFVLGEVDSHLVGHLLESGLLGHGVVDQAAVGVLLDQVGELVAERKHVLALLGDAVPAVLLDLEPDLEHVHLARALDGLVAGVLARVLVGAVGHEELLGLHRVHLLEDVFVAGQLDGSLLRAHERLVEVLGNRVHVLESAHEFGFGGCEHGATAQRAVCMQPHALLFADRFDLVKRVNGAKDRGANGCVDHDRFVAQGDALLDQSLELTGDHQALAVCRHVHHILASNAHHDCSLFNRVVRTLGGKYHHLG